MMSLVAAWRWCLSSLFLQLRVCLPRVSMAAHRLQYPTSHLYCAVSSILRPRAGTLVMRITGTWLFGEHCKKSACSWSLLRASCSQMVRNQMVWHWPLGNLVVCWCGMPLALTLLRLLTEHMQLAYWGRLLKLQRRERVLSIGAFSRSIFHTSSHWVFGSNWSKVGMQD